MLMLSKEAFDVGRSALETQWPKEAVKLTNPLIRKAWISAAKRLTDEEWYQAVEIAIARCEFMPPIEKIIEFVKPNREAQALQDWVAIAQIVPLSIPEARERLLQLNPQARTALQAIGGLGSIKVADSRDLLRLEKQFILVYTQPIDKSVLCLPQAAVLDTQEVIVDIAYDWDHVERACRGNKEYHLSQLSEKGRSCLESVDMELTMSSLTSGELWRAFKSKYNETPGSSKKPTQKGTPITEEQRIELIEKLKAIGMKL